MRVLYVQGSAERAGAERILHGLLKYLDRDEVQPTVLFLADGPFVDEIRALDVPVVVRPHPMRVREFWKWRGVTDEIKRSIESTDAQIVQATGEKVAIFASRAAQSGPAKTLAWLHDAPRAGGLRGSIVQKLFARRSFSKVVTCSKWMAEAFGQSLSVPTVPIVNGLDLDELAFKPGSLSEIKSMKGWDKDAQVIGHFARLQRWKGTDVFVRAAATLISRGLDLKFLVVGGSLYNREVEFAQELKKLTSNLGIEESVLFTGWRADALSIMGEVNVVAHCSVSLDPFPTVILEAMALGRPVIGTRTKGPEEAIEDGSTGLLIPPSDHEALAASIEKLVRDKDLRREIGLAAKSVAFERFDARRMASEFQTLYRNLTTINDVAGARN